MILSSYTYINLLKYFLTQETFQFESIIRLNFLIQAAFLTQALKLKSATENLQPELKRAA